MTWHGDYIQMTFFPSSQVGSFEIPKIETPTTLDAHHFFCKPFIEVRFEEKI
jgi:hypothetical protein